jgi:hypothetical protein
MGENVLKSSPLKPVSINDKKLEAQMSLYRSPDINKPS